MLTDSSILFWCVAGAIVVLGLGVIGFRDSRRFSARRTWAISGIAFTEAVRRRVLWITPLAMLGVIIVAQFQNPFDEQDLIRETIKVCLFSTGLVVCIVTLILAGTNLPKEIDTRVIYTVVTKPATRLEIVAGKVLGLARVSAMILLIMGLFTLGYLYLREWNLQRQIDSNLRREDSEDVASRTIWEHYRQAGLLSAKVYALPSSLQVYSRLPQASDTRRWMFWVGEQDLLVPFRMADVPKVAAQTGIWIRAAIGYERSQAAESDAENHDVTAPTSQGPYVISIGGIETGRPPTLEFLVMDARREAICGVVDPTRANQPPEKQQGPIEIPPAATGRPAVAYIPPETAAKLLDHDLIYVQISGGREFEYSADPSSVQLFVRDPSPDATPTFVKPSAAPIFRGRFANYGRAIRGTTTGRSATAIFSFQGAGVSAGPVPFELKLSVERDYSVTPREKDEPTRLELVVSNAKNPSACTIQIIPDPNRTNYFSIPATAIAGGDFDILVRSRSDGHWVGLTPRSLKMVRASHPFSANLAKSLGIMWLLSVLIAAMAVLCSTFLSWPIAIMLTVVLLVGRWTTDQLGEGSGSGLGRQVATDLGFRDPAKAKVVSSGVEALTTGMHTLVSVMPDLAQFAATEDIDRGTDIAWKTFGNAVRETMAFGLPIVVLAYLVLKHKEVAP